MRIVKEILGVKGLKSLQTTDHSKDYITPNIYDLDFYLKMTLLPTDLGISKTDLFLHSLTPVILKDTSNTIELRCGTFNPMICVL